MSILPNPSDKGFKTTIVAYISLIIIVACLVAMFMKLITGSEFQEIVTGTVAASVIVLGFLTKDADKSGLDKS